MSSLLLVTDAAVVAVVEIESLAEIDKEEEAVRLNSVDTVAVAVAVAVGVAVAVIVGDVDEDAVALIEAVKLPDVDEVVHALIV